MPEKLRQRFAAVAGRGVGVAVREARSTTREQWVLFGLSVVAAGFLGFVAGAFAYSDSSALASARKENEALQRDSEKLAVARTDLDRVARERDDAEKRAEAAEKRASRASDARASTAQPEPASSSTASALPGIGGRCRLELGPSPFVPVFQTAARVSEWHRAVTVGDKHFAREMAAFAFSVDKGTRALVLDSEGFFTGVYKVRILEGESEGKSGWVDREWAKKIE